MTHLTCALLNICREILAGRCGHAAFTEEEVGTVYDRYSSGIIMKFIKEWFEPADYYGIRVTTMYKLFDQVHPNNVKTQKTFISIVDSNYGCKSSMRVVRSDRDRWKLEYVGGGISGPKMLPGYRIKPEKYEEILNDGMLPEVDRGDESGKKPNSTA